MLAHLCIPVHVCTSFTGARTVTKKDDVTRTAEVLTARRGTGGVTVMRTDVGDPVLIRERGIDIGTATETAAGVGGCNLPHPSLYRD